MLDNDAETHCSLSRSDPKYQGNDKNNQRRNEREKHNDIEFRQDKFFFTQTIDEVLFQCFVAVFVPNHGNHNNGKKEFK